jgi:hypothetical protein
MTEIPETGLRLQLDACGVILAKESVRMMGIPETGLVPIQISLESITVQQQRI